MNELIEAIKSNLDSWGELTEVLLNAISLLCIVAGVILSLTRSLKEKMRTSGDHPLHTYFRRIFGGWLVVILMLVAWIWAFAQSQKHVDLTKEIDVPVPAGSK